MRHKDTGKDKDILIAFEFFSSLRILLSIQRLIALAKFHVNLYAQYRRYFDVEIVCYYFHAAKLILLLSISVFWAQILFHTFVECFNTMAIQCDWAADSVAI